ncbi:hypothetical protein [Rhizobium sp. 18065]|uniref:hypothetical protein n=1 Tax=Rhizobium sp. 18065 TaxID=2681411 RepID=UPI00135AE527|nr:hypothetical protein [Rhizobium sp. 18065]
MLNLSGGNRQKVVLVKPPAQKPRLAIFHEPTRGVEKAARSPSNFRGRARPQQQS